MEAYDTLKLANTIRYSLVRNLNNRHCGMAKDDDIGK
jgi:hypothetical protein